MRKIKYHQYLVRLSPHAKVKVDRASSVSNARKQAWDTIKDGYTYGWTQAGFMSSAPVEMVR